MNEDKIRAVLALMDAKQKALDGLCAAIGKLAVTSNLELSGLEAYLLSEEPRGKKDEK